MMNSEALGAYQQARQKRLDSIVEVIKKDERFIAAWLTGSLGRGGGDPISDLDLNIVVRSEDAATLCSQPWQSAGKTTPQREALFKQFGTPTIIHDTHANAPPHGCFTLTFYAEDHQEVDWILLPQLHAKRPFDTLLLFEKEPIPVEEPPIATMVEIDPERLSEQVSYFWLMAAAGIKFIIREKTWRANEQIQIMNMMLNIVKDTLEYEERPLTPLPLMKTTAEQKATVRELCQHMQTLKEQILATNAKFPERAIETVEARLTLVQSE